VRLLPWVLLLPTHWRATLLKLLHRLLLLLCWKVQARKDGGATARTLLLRHVAPLRPTTTTSPLLMLLAPLLLLLTPLLLLLAIPLLLWLLLVWCMASLAVEGPPTSMTSRCWALLLLAVASTCLLVVALLSGLLVMLLPVFLDKIIQAHV
jgi:hypothetical protein